MTLKYAYNTCTDGKQNLIIDEHAMPSMHVANRGTLRYSRKLVQSVKFIDLQLLSMQL